MSTKKCLAGELIRTNWNWPQVPPVPIQKSLCEWQPIYAL